MEEVSFCLLLFVVVISYMYVLLIRNRKTFKNRGVEYEKPIIFFGNMFNVFVGKETESSLMESLYERFTREKLFGVFILHRPVFVIKDFELAKRIMITEFNSFAKYTGNGVSGVSDEIVHKSLMYLEGAEWRATRNILKPVFTISLLEESDRKLQSIASNLLHRLHKRNQKCFAINSKEVFGTFLAECVSTIVLGKSGDDSEIVKVQQVIKCMEKDFKCLSGSMKFLLSSLIPRFTSVKVFSKDVDEFFDQNVIQVMRRTDTNKQDLVHLLTKATNNGDGVAISAHLLVFFVGGYDSTLKLLQMVFVEISLNQEIQSQLIDEVEQSIIELNGEPITRATLEGMRLLELVILETLRKNPPIKCGTRICTKDCSIKTDEGELFKFVKGDTIHLPFDLMQNDKKFFRHPEMFDPFRFNKDASNNFLLTFGQGPRNCLGTKFVLLQAKFLIFSILSKYSVKPCDKTPKSLNDDWFFELSLRK